MATIANALKIIQEDSPDLVKNVARKSPFFTTIAHKEDFTGESIAWPVSTDGLGGGSYTATDAEANDVNMGLLKFRIEPKSVYSYRTLDGLQARQGFKGGVSTEYMDVIKGEMEAGLATLAKLLFTNLQRSTTNRVAVRSSVSSNTIKLTKRTDAYLVNKGDKLVASATDGGALLDSGDYFTVVSIDHGKGEVTVDDVTTISGFSDGHSIFIKGNINKGVAGLDTYVPATAPTGGDNVFGSAADRSVAPEAAAGVRWDNAGTNKATCLLPFLAHMQSTPAYDPGSESAIYCHPNDIADIAVQLEGNRFVDDDNEYGIGVQAFRVGSSKLIPDAFVSPGTFKFVPKNAGVTFRSVDGFKVDDMSGQEITNKAGDKYQIKCLIDGNLQVKNPGALGRGDWPTNG